MAKEIIISSSTTQNRVAITENEKLVDFFVDHPEKKRMVGDVYFGKVARVLPGIRAAFVDIGWKHDAFLHFSDIGDRWNTIKAILDDDNDTEVSEEQDDDDELVESKSKNKNFKTSERVVPRLFKGQEIIVQIIKEPVKDKGVRVTSSISIAGRFCVLLPMDGKVGISKKISDYRERKRLKKLARSIIPNNFGIIIRTAARNQSEEALVSDLKFLMKSWEQIQKNVKSKQPPSLVYNDLSTTSSVIRDLFTPDVKKIFIDSKQLYREINNYIEVLQPSLSDRVEYFNSKQPIFDAFKIEEQIKEMMGRKVMMPSGGYIYIDHTEAMTVIDVNSGKYAAKKEQELNSLKTDLEAAREIARQLRLRDIGGLFVVDFIDLEEDKNRKKIYDELKKEFRKDRAKVAILPMTDFGIIQMTRERVRENILQSMNELCPYCQGSGMLTKKSNLIFDIEEWIKRFKIHSKERGILLRVHPSLARRLEENRFSTLLKLKFKYFIKIKLELDEAMSPSIFKIYSRKTGEDITTEF